MAWHAWFSVTSKGLPAKSMSRLRRPLAAPLPSQELLFDVRPQLVLKKMSPFVAPVAP
jgi:hypothetical protein